MGTATRTATISANRGYPALRSVIQGMPATNLQSLLWFEDGTVGAAHPGPYANAVPGGANATKFLGTNPTKQSFGLATNVDGDGLVINTLIPFTRDFTVIGSIKSTTPPATTQWIGWCSPTAHSFPGTPTGTYQNAPAPWPTARVHGAGTTPSGNGHIILDNSATEIPSGQNPTLTSAVAPSDQATVVGYRCTANIAGTQGRLEIVTLPKRGLEIPDIFGAAKPTDASIINTALFNYFSAFEAASTFMVGAWPTLSNRPCNAECYAFAVYNARLDDDVLNEAMIAMAARVASRGISVFNYPIT